MDRKTDIKTKQPSLKKNAALNMIKMVMSLIFPLITFPYSSRVLGPVSIGKVNFAQSVVSYFSLIAALGISTYAIREAAKLRENKKELSVFTREILTINMISTLAAYILLALAIFIVPQFENYRKLLCICGASILFTTIGMDYLYTALEEFKYITIRSIIFQFISLGLLFTLVKNQDDYLKYAAVSVISSVGSNILNFLHTRKFIDFKLTKDVQISLKKHLKPIFTLFAMSAAISIYTVLDTTMLGLIKGDEAVGIYTAATKLNRMVIMMITAATGVLLPRLSYYANSGEKTEFLRLVDKAMQFVVLFSVPCAAGLFVLSEPAVLLFSGTKYLSAIPVMKIMNAIIVFISLSNVTGIQIFMSVGKENTTLFSVIIGSVVNFILNMILIPQYGAAGAAIGTVAAEFTVTAIQLVFAGKYIPYKNLLHHSIKVVCSALIMAFCVHFVSDFFESLILKLLLGITSGIIIYIICMLVFKDKFSLDFFNELKVRIKGSKQ